MQPKITIKRPDKFGNLQDGDFEYSSDSHPTFSFDTEFIIARGTPLQEYNQAALMEEMRGIMKAIGKTLRACGSILVEVSMGIKPDEFLSAMLFVPDEVSKITAMEAIGQIDEAARKLAVNHPDAKFRFRMDVYTTFSDVKIKLAPRWHKSRSRTTRKI